MKGAALGAAAPGDPETIVVASELRGPQELALRDRAHARPGGGAGEGVFAGPPGRGLGHAAHRGLGAGLLRGRGPVEVGSVVGERIRSDLADRGEGPGGARCRDAGRAETAPPPRAAVGRVGPRVEARSVAGDAVRAGRAACTVPPARTSAVNPLRLPSGGGPGVRVFSEPLVPAAGAPSEPSPPHVATAVASEPTNATFGDYELCHKRK
jgi:hypothetical protein